MGFSNGMRMREAGGGNNLEARKTVLWVGEHAAPAGDLSLGPKTHTGWLTTAFNSSFGAIQCSLLNSTGTCTHVHVPAHHPTPQRIHKIVLELKTAG